MRVLAAEQPRVCLLTVSLGDGESCGVGVMLVLVVTVTCFSSHQMVRTGLHCEHWISFHPHISFLHSILRLWSRSFGVLLNIVGTGYGVIILLIVII